MKIHNEYQQGSLEWMTARSGIPTASEFDQIFTPKFELRKGEMPETYLCKKIAEWWQGSALAEYASWDMDQGKILEDEAIPMFTLETGNEVQRVGFVTNDEGTVGCSPDGLLKVGGIEVKCPRIDTHIKYVLGGEVPEKYLAQVHGSMFVTGAVSWHFMSYHRRTPSLIVWVPRDPVIQDKIATGIGEFLKRFEAAKTQLCELNGGPPKRYEPARPQAIEVFYDDLIP